MTSRTKKGVAVSALDLSIIDPEIDADRLTEDPEVDEILHGAVDLHTHPGPSPLPRRVGIADLARDAAAAGFRAIVAKSHHHSMQTDVLALRNSGALPDEIQVFGGVACNRTVGGLNPYAVELALRMGGRVVWLPTISSTAHHAHEHDATQVRFPSTAIPLREQQPIEVVGPDGNPVPELLEVLEVVAAEGAILNMGHLAADDIDRVLPLVHEMGIERIVVSHPSFIVRGSQDTVTRWVRSGVTIEHCLSLLTSRRVVRMDLDGLLAYLRAGDVALTVLSSDLGQKGNPLPLTAYRRVIRQLLDAGVAASDLERMACANPAGLLFEGR